VSDAAGAGDNEAGAVSVRESVLHEIEAHARAEWPNECCGLLIGREGAIDTSYRARNELKSSTRYRIAPEDHFAAVRHARGLRLEVIGAYHSHPAGAPTPSWTDRLEALPGDFLYVIAGRGQDEATVIRGWRMVDGNFVPVPLVTH
jgi:proteasome lid subunit RPN8/RPN11